MVVRKEQIKNLLSVLVDDASISDSFIVDTEIKSVSAASGHTVHEHNKIGVLGVELAQNIRKPLATLAQRALNSVHTILRVRAALELEARLVRVHQTQRDHSLPLPRFIVHTQLQHLCNN